MEKQVLSVLEKCIFCNSRTNSREGKKVKISPLRLQKHLKKQDLLFHYRTNIMQVKEGIV